MFVYVSDYESYGEEAPCAKEDHLVYASARNGSRIYAYDSAQEVAALHEAGLQ